jgi:hypothetical protein
MIKALIRTVLLVAAVLVLSRFSPWVAAHETALLVAAVALGLFGIIARIFLVLLLLGAVLLFFHPFF